MSGPVVSSKVDPWIPQARPTLSPCHHVCRTCRPRISEIERVGGFFVALLSFLPPAFAAGAMGIRDFTLLPTVKPYEPLLVDEHFIPEKLSCAVMEEAFGTRIFLV